MPSERYFGTEFEHDLFGTVDVRNPKYQEALKKVSQDAKGYVNYNDSMDLARHFQPAPPDGPKKEFAKELRNEVADKLGLEDKDVLFYTAVKTPLDLWHGTDAFLTVKTVEGEFTVKLDASLRDKEEHKADILVTGVPDPNLNEDAFTKAIDGIAAEVLRIIETKKKESERRNAPNVYRRVA